MNNSKLFKGGAIVISIDTEQIWGHFDLLSEADFSRRYPDACSVNDRLLQSLCSAGISATWDVVGALSFESCDGPRDKRMAGLPQKWVGRIPAGDEGSQPLWYRRRFVQAIRDASPNQEIALHGGLTHMVWQNGNTPSDVLYRELSSGFEALEDLNIQPRSFVFPRDIEGHHELLRKVGIQCYRGRAPITSEWLGFNLAGSLARAIEEVATLTPPPVWPTEVRPGLWNVPASMAIYSMARTRCRFVPLHLRLRRVRLGVEEAVRKGGIFHLVLHPENLAESPEAFETFESILAYCNAMRRDGVDVLTMSQALDRARTSAWRQ